MNVNKPITENSQDEREKFLNKKTNRPYPQSQSQKFPYYCSLCGFLSIKSSAIFDSLPRRTTDDSIICVIGRVSIENNLSQSKLIIIHRGNNKYEKQYTYICKNCGTLIAYQSTSFEDDNLQDVNKQKQLALFNKGGPKIIYILSDALVTDPQQSSLCIEIDKIKNGKSSLNSNLGYMTLRLKKK